MIDLLHLRYYFNFMASSLGVQDVQSPALCLVTYAGKLRLFALFCFFFCCSLSDAIDPLLTRLVHIGRDGWTPLPLGT